MSQIPDLPMSVRAYAKRRGCSHVAVQKAIKSGRLRESVARDENGAPKIADPDLADREWAANTDLTDATVAVLEASRTWPGKERPAPAASELEDTADSTAREKFWKANLAELKFRQAAGELIEAKTVERGVADDYAAVRVRLLGLPSQLKQDLPELTIDALAKVEARVREALEEISGE